jgi:hypothetical protein
MINEFIEYVKEVWGLSIIAKPSTEPSDTFESLFCDLEEIENEFNM